MTVPALDIRNLSVGYAGETGIIPAVENFDLTIAPGEFVGLAGESGCGKSTVAQSILRVLRAPGIITGGEIRIAGTDILGLDDDAVRALRWKAVSIVMQNALTALNPVHRIGWQLQEALDRAEDRAGLPTPAELLGMVSIDARRLTAYPYELSGGQRQRVAIAMALALKPALVILDEPTTALDVIVQQEIFRLVARLRESLGFAVLLITHDLPLLFDVADRLAVMQKGRLVETATIESFRREQKHAYSRQLLAATPRLDALRPPDMPKPKRETILKTRDLQKAYSGHKALDGVSLEIAAGEIVAVVGESGSGKSTLGRVVTGLTSPTGGEVTLDGHAPIPVSRRRRSDPRPAQMVFQDVYGSLNPLHTVHHHLRRAVIRAPKPEPGNPDVRVAALLEQVGLTPPATYMARRPHELSGGQRQRVGIARALASRPRLLVADEPVSMLDVSIRLDVLRLLARLRDEDGVALLYITHDIVSAGFIADRIVVMLAGRIVEAGPALELLRHPQHGYTQRLIAAVPGGSGTAPQLQTAEA